MREDTLVKARYEREPDNAPGAFYVIKDACMLCSLPVETAPGNVTWTADTMDRGAGSDRCPTHCRVERQRETPDELARVLQAAEFSCIEAVRYCGTDPVILSYFRDRGLERLCDAL